MKTEEEIKERIDEYMARMRDDLTVWDLSHAGRVHDRIIALEWVLEEE